MQVQISKEISVNPRHVVFVILNPKLLKTIVVTLGGKVESEHTFKKTNQLLNEAGE